MNEIVESAVAFLKGWKAAKEGRGVYVGLHDLDACMRSIWPDMSQEDGIAVLQRVNYTGGPVTRVLP